MLRTEMAVFAARFNLTPAEAVTLPAVFEHAALSQNLEVRGLVSLATYDSPKVGQYLADLAKEVATKVAA